MTKKNLFIVNTPFHLLTSFILANSRFKQEENYLALIHPHGYERWADNPVLRYMSSTESGYKQVFPLGNCWSSRHKEKTYKEQTDAIKASIGQLAIDDVFLGSDIDVQNQLLASALGKEEFYRYEDGLYSYYNENRRRSFGDMLFHKFKIKVAQWLSGIHSKMYINTSTASDSRAGRGDFMYYPELLQRFSPDVKEISKAMIIEALAELGQNGLMPKEIEKKSILYLSQPLVEQKKITLDEEFAILKGICDRLDESCQLLYKPHPNDSQYKLDFYRKELPDMKLYTSLKPVELVFASEEHIAAVMSYQSTALITAGKFSPRVLPVISLAGFYREPLHQAYIDIMKGAGVLFPKSVEALLQVLPVKSMK